MMEKPSVQMYSIIYIMCFSLLARNVQGGLSTVSTAIFNSDVILRKPGVSEVSQSNREANGPTRRDGHEDDPYDLSGYGLESDTGYGQSKGYGGGGGGYGHGGGHGGGYGHGAITLDPVSIISLLALGAFLINNILQLLRTNMQTGRSLNVRDIDVPLDLSDWNFDKSSDVLVSQSQSRVLEDDASGPNFTNFFANVGSLYYLHPKKRNMCIKRVVCNYINSQQSREETKGTLRGRIFEFMLSTITRLVAPEIKDRSKAGICEKFNKYCSDAVLHDAKISTENKVFSTVTSLASNFAFQRLFAG